MDYCSKCPNETECYREGCQICCHQEHEIERLKQALADAHGLLISYGKTSDHFEDLKHDVELHFDAFRKDTNPSDSGRFEESPE